MAIDVLALVFPGTHLSVVQDEKFESSIKSIKANISIPSTFSISNSSFGFDA